VDATIEQPEQVGVTALSALAIPCDNGTSGAREIADFLGVETRGHIQGATTRPEAAGVIFISTKN
jgi:hypothetical protein